MSGTWSLKGSPARPGRLAPRRLIALDGLAAAGYLLVLGQPSVVRVDLPAGLAVALLLALVVPVTVRRVWPVPVFLVVIAASLAALAVGLLLDPLLAAAFALYPVALRARRSWIPIAATGAVAAVVLVGGSMAGTPYRAQRPVELVVLGTGLLAASWTVGRMVRARRGEVVRATGEVVGRAMAEERLRVAREMHDVLAHSMSLIAIKAGTANHVVAVRPEEATDALRVIESTSRTALAEIRHLLGMLRSDVDGVALCPAPGLSDLPALAERARQAGVTVDLHVRTADQPPAGLALSVYRIVQEALTNVVRHAPRARCQVSVITGPTDVRIDVVDDGTGGTDCPDRRPGHGLIGMRERVLMYGGQFQAGPQPQGGFAVSARIPFAP